MIYVKTAEEIEKMRLASDLVSRTLGEVAKWVKPGETTHRLDSIAREFILDNGGKPACLGYQGFPGTLCIEVNETVVHGFPSTYTLREGDIVGTDCVAELNGFNGDSCYTFAVGEVDEQKRHLLDVTLQSLYVGIEQARAGKRIGDISNAVQTYCEHRGYSVVREMCGHGICIEPMINAGSKNIVIAQNGWECRTRDRKPSAHFEHTLLITEDAPEILTTFRYIEEALGIPVSGDRLQA